MGHSNLVSNKEARFFCSQKLMNEINGFNSKVAFEPTSRSTIFNAPIFSAKIFLGKPFLGKEGRVVFPIPLKPLFVNPREVFPLSCSSLPNQTLSSNPLFPPKNHPSEIVITD